MDAAVRRVRLRAGARKHLGLVPGRYRAAYERSAGRYGADRDDFDDAIDFVGWYTHQSQTIAGISKWDPYNQYLAYHEGQTGWLEKSYRFKTKLRGIARSVDYRAREWGAQLRRCEDDLDGGWWFS